MNIRDLVGFMAADHKIPTGQGGRDFDSYLPTRKFIIPVDKKAALESGMITAADSMVVDTMYVDLGEKTSYIIKDQLAIMDIIATNIWKRPIYWAVTCREDRLLGLDDYLQLEGLSLRLVPVKSESQTEFGIIGSGRVNTDQAFDNIMNKWAWGNFDKERLYVNRSYMPSLQTMKFAMMRIGNELVAEGKKDKAIALTDKFFEVFPKMNFPYDQFSAYMADIYGQSGATDKAAARMRDIAADTEQTFRFIQSQDPYFEKAYQQDYQMAVGTVQTLIGSATRMKDQALADELKKQFEPYLPTQGPGLPGLKR
jgi:hypothetical protein